MELDELGEEESEGGEGDFAGATGEGEVEGVRGAGGGGLEHLCVCLCFMCFISNLRTRHRCFNYLFEDDGCIVVW